MFLDWLMLILLSHCYYDFYKYVYLTYSRVPNRV